MTKTRNNFSRNHPTFGQRAGQTPTGQPLDHSPTNKKQQISGRKFHKSNIIILELRRNFISVWQVAFCKEIDFRKFH